MNQIIHKSNSVLTILSVILIVLMTRYMSYAMYNMWMFYDDNLSAQMSSRTLSICLIFLMLGICIYGKKYLGLTPVGRSVLSFFIYISIIAFFYLLFYNSSITTITTRVGLLMLPIFSFFSFYILSKSKVDKRILNILFAFFFISVVVDYFNQLYSNILLLDRNINVVYYIVIAFPIILFLNKKPISIVSFLIVSYAVLLSGKRGGVVALALGLIAYILFAQKKTKYLFYIAATTLMVVFAFNNIQISNRTLNRFDTADITSGRSNIYKDVFENYIESNVLALIVGNGYDAVAKTTSEGMTAHNDFLEILYDYGLIGLILFISLHVAFIKKILRMHKAGNDYLSVAIFLYSIFAVFSMVSHVVIYPYCFVLTAILGYLDGINSQQNNTVFIK